MTSSHVETRRWRARSCVLGRVRVWSRYERSLLGSGTDDAAASALGSAPSSLCRLRPCLALSRVSLSTGDHRARRS
jgi:hypothetical protein